MQLTVRPIVLAAGLLCALGGPPLPPASAGEHPVSPARRIDRDAGPRHPPGPHRASGHWRSYDGSGNNPLVRDMGARRTPLLRLLPAAYADGRHAPAGPDRPGPRAISNAVHRQDRDRPAPGGASDYLWQWGQFLDHDLDLTDGMDPPEPAPIPVPAGDPEFDPHATGVVTIAFNRSLYAPASVPRQQLNEITAWIDGSNVYGSSAARARALRTNDGTGRLRTSAGELLPFNADGLPNAGGASPALFLAGDVRANEQVGLTALHTLFVREHNRLAARLARRHPGWSGERIYHKARQLVGAELQVITYREFLPALLGPGALPPYRGYRPDIDASIANEFATAAYRFGHSAVGSRLLRLDAAGAPIPPGHLALRDAFFAPRRILDEGGIEPVLRGLAAQPCQAIDVHVVEDLRSFLFGPPGAGGFDLPALNIQRGRDHGLPGYNAARVALGLAPARTFADISGDPDVQARLAAVYAGPGAVDLWVGGLAEDPRPDSHLGELFHRVIVDQFRALRDGDRYWYRRTLAPAEIRWAEAVTLAQVIRRNTAIGPELPDDVFHVAGGGPGPPAGHARRAPERPEPAQNRIAPVPRPG